MNTKTFNVLSLVYVGVAILEIISEWTDNRTLHLRSKPFLVLLVIGIFLAATHGTRHKAKILVVIALIFSWLGDVSLMFKQEYSWSFLCGLGAFLISHVFYIIAYRADTGGKFQFSLYAFVPIIGYGVVLFSILAPHLGTMQIPVAVYAVVLLAMFAVALERGGRVSRESYWWVLVGATCFVLSDSILAWHSFVQPSTPARVMLMTLYISAQYAIARGMAQQITEKIQE